MRNEKRKRPNAQKHGIFAAPPVIPGEDAQEFDRLHSALVEEWMPSGATEEDAVFTIAHAMWRKRRAQTFLEVRLMTNPLDTGHPAYDEILGLHVLASTMMYNPETAFQEFAGRLLRDDKLNYLKRRFPRSNFKSVSEWAEAIINEINSMVALRTTMEVPEERHEGLDQGYKVVLFKSSALSADLFKEELALSERLEAMIDRAVKRLVQTKAMKQMLSQTSTERADDQQGASSRERLLIDHEVVARR